MTKAMFKTDEMQAWYQDQPGQWLWHLEQKQALHWLKKLQGDNLLQVGGLKDLAFQKVMQVPHYFYLSNCLNSMDADVFGDPMELPFLPQSIDTVLLFHVIEFLEHPSIFLKEIYDMLKPGGKVILFSFNPWSSWGANKRIKSRNQFPWCGKFWSRNQIKQWLNWLSYSRLVTKTICFRTPWASHDNQRTSQFFEVLGRMCFSSLGGVTFFVFEKRTYASRQVEAISWRKQRVAQRHVPRPTMKT